MDTPTLPWVALLALGAAHGLNPAMGWLFAVGRGLLDRDRRALWGALAPLALGHALAVAAAIALAATLGQVIPLGWLRWLIAAALVAVGADGLVRHRHVRLAGMRASARELATWSFLMASAHGAGLMVLPFVLGRAVALPPGHAHAHAHAHGSMETHAALVAGAVAAGGDVGALVAPLVHTLGYLLVTCALAVLVYENVGLRVLRGAWINVNAIWSAALIAAGVAAAFV